MDRQDRGKIDRCRDEISRLIDMKKLWPQLVRNEVFHEDDVNVPKWENTLNQESTVCNILDTIKTRGPRAFRNLLRSLHETNHSNVAYILEGNQPLPSNGNIPNDESQALNNNPNDEDDQWYTDTKFMTTEDPLVVAVKPATRFMDDPDEGAIGKYFMRKKPHGYVLIISVTHYFNDDNRISAIHDKHNLKKLFEDMGFEVTVPEPQEGFTGAEIKKIIRDFSKRDFSKVDSCFVIISAHGGQVECNGTAKSEIRGWDYYVEGAERVTCEDIIDMFTVSNCPLLNRKPKVFIFQACRGEGQQKLIRHATDGNDTSHPTRNYSDILVAQSTIRGHLAYRDHHNGSWYIQVLCEVFMRYACTMHIQDLFNMVDSRLKKLRTLDGEAQTSSVKSLGFNQHLFLNPGIFEEEP